MISLSDRSNLQLNVHVYQISPIGGGIDSRVVPSNPVLWRKALFGAYSCSESKGDACLHWPARPSCNLDAPSSVTFPFCTYIYFACLCCIYCCSVVRFPFSFLLQFTLPAAWLLIAGVTDVICFLVGSWFLSLLQGKHATAPALVD